MARSKRAHEHFRLNAIKIRRAQHALCAATETETVEWAPDLVIAEHKRKQPALNANERFVRSGAKIGDFQGT